MPYYFDNAHSLIGNLLKKTYKNWKLLIEPQVNFFYRQNDKNLIFVIMIVIKVIKAECLLIIKFGID